MPIPPLPKTFNIPHEFPITKHWDFYNHAGVSPLCSRASDALRHYAHRFESNAYLNNRFYERAEIIRRNIATLINADHSELAYIKNTSEGIAFVANGLTWNPGDEIISTNVEYPANVYPWMDLAQRFGVKHIMVPEKNGRIETADLLAAVTPRTRMIAISHVEYASGFRNDLATLGAFTRPRNILLCVDAIQSLGILPVDVQAMNIDFLSADGHKWLLGPEGLGIFYCRRELIPSLHPEIGWLNVINALDYGAYDFTLRPDAKRFECGSYNIAGILALGASLDLLNEVGPDLITARIKSLTDQLATGIIEKGYRLISPREQRDWSGIISFTLPPDSPLLAPSQRDASITAAHNRIITDLEKQKILIVQREGRLRASPHFYNTPEQITRLINALPHAHTMMSTAEPA